MYCTDVIHRFGKKIRKPSCMRTDTLYTTKKASCRPTCCRWAVTETTASGTSQRTPHTESQHTTGFTNHLQRKLLYNWGIKNQLIVTCYFYFTYYLLNMFRTLICPSSGACDCFDGLPHRLSCSVRTDVFAISVPLRCVTQWCTVQ